MEKQSYRLIVTDLDRTLLRTDETIAPYTLKIWERCRAQGRHMGVATARAEDAAMQYLEVLRPELVISNNGGAVRWRGEFLHQQFLNGEELFRLATECMESPGIDVITAQTCNGYFADRTPADLRLPGGFAIPIPWNFADPIAHGVYKLTVHFDRREAVDALAKQFPNLRPHFFTGENWCSFTHRDATKLRGLQEFSRQTGIVPGEMVAFGDDHSDVEMLRACGAGVAVANAIPEVLAVADVVTLSNDEDGVARYLEKHLL